MKWGVVRFPGSLDDVDAVYATARRDGPGRFAAVAQGRKPRGAECIVLPGGFSYGDYLRCGAIARFSPIMNSVAKFAADGGLVIGICNGFQILCEAHLLPGALTRNRIALVHLRASFIVRVENAQTPFTRADARRRDSARCRSSTARDATSRRPTNSLQMEERGQVMLRYVDAAGDATEAANPNGSMRSIAGVANDRFNVFGLMPHPEHAVEGLLGGADGLRIFQSIISSRRARMRPSCPAEYAHIAGRTESRCSHRRARTDSPTTNSRASQRMLGRAPTFTELGVFSVMWSEHCSYKSSRKHLQNAAVARGATWSAGPGENAGAIDVGDGWVAVFKIESHNHPSYVEPYQGAATGVGGILRDIFTMGARPVANMDSLKFGSFDHPRTRYSARRRSRRDRRLWQLRRRAYRRRRGDVRRRLQRQYPRQCVLARPRAPGGIAERARPGRRKSGALRRVRHRARRNPRREPARLGRVRCRERSRNGRPFRSAIRSPRNC